FALEDVVLARHRVLVLPQRRPRVGERIDQVQLLHATAIGPSDVEALGIRRPGDVRPDLAVGGRDLGPGPSTAATAVPAEPTAEGAEAVLLLAVGRELDGLGLLSVVGEIQVVLLGEHEPLAIGRVVLVVAPRTAEPTLGLDLAVVLFGFLLVL